MIFSIDPDDADFAVDVTDDAANELLEEDVKWTASLTWLADMRSP